MLIWVHKPSKRGDNPGRGETMSEREKKMAEGLAKLPEALQEKFIEQITGAAMAVEVMRPKEEREEAKPAGAG